MRRAALALVAALGAGPAWGQAMDHDMAGHEMAGQDMAGHDMEGMEMPAETPQASQGHGMGGALGAYPMSREASGTSWQPQAAPHEGLHRMAGPWMLMAHATVNGVYDWQSGPRGDEQAFLSGMLTGMARRDLGASNTLQLRAMLSPDPVIGKRGYPLLLASGETADGATPLVDRQHPHDLFMELSASLAHLLDAQTSIFVYAGLPGEPAFGPPAFMHRPSIQDSPEAPISHHWLDSTHITFGVVTAGLIRGDWKLEASAFKGREPDAGRYDIETPKLDSYAARISWNPTANWALQASWARLDSPEQLEPDDDQTRWSASALYTRPLGEALWSSTLAWGRRTSGHHDLDAYVAESALRWDSGWALFGRAEQVANNELVAGVGGHGPTYQVAKVSLGAVKDWPLTAHWSVGLGGLYALDFVPSALKDGYGPQPRGAMAFVRLKLH